MPTIERVALFVLGASLVVFTLLSTIRTFVLPRSARDTLTYVIFRNSRRVFMLLNLRSKTYEDRDRLMALYAPVTLLIMPAIWLVLVAIGYTGIFMALGVESVKTAFTVSGSALLTTGTIPPDGTVSILMSFSEGTIGLILVALLIAYLPTIYGAFSRREAAVTLLEVRAGSPPSAEELFARFHRLKRMDKLNELWSQWENFFVDIEESHTSLAMLAFFRSPQPDRSWITAAGAVLDAAALAVSTIDIEHDVQADLTIRAGYIALRRIADYFNVPYNSKPTATDPISISRLEFDLVCERLIAQGVPVKADRDKAWHDFSGWRVNYDTQLLSLCAITMAPYAPWSSDRSVRQMHWLQVKKQQKQAFFARLFRRQRVVSPADSKSSS